VSRMGCDVTMTGSNCLKQAQALLGHLKDAPKKARQITARAMNRTIVSVKNETAKEVGKKYNISAANVKSVTKITTDRENYLVARYKATKGFIKLIKFNVRPNTLQQPPVVLRAEVMRGKDRALSKRWFLAPFKGLGVNVVMRKGKKRFPLRWAYGPAIPQMIGNREIIDRIRLNAYATLEKRMEHELGRILEDS